MLLKDLALHLDLSERRVRDILKRLEMNHRENSLEEIRVGYIRMLREQAANRSEVLTIERIKTEQVDREIKEIKLAELKGSLINTDELLMGLSSMMLSFKNTLKESMVDLKQYLDSEHGINCEIDAIMGFMNDALERISEYDPGRSQDDQGSMPDFETEETSTHA